MDIKPNPGCVNSACRRMQKAFQDHQASPAAQRQRQAAAAAMLQQEDKPATHAENEWGIEVVSDVTEPDAHADHASAAEQHLPPKDRKQAYSHALPEGLQYSLPVRLHPNRSSCVVGSM